MKDRIERLARKAYNLLITEEKCLAEAVLQAYSLEDFDWCFNQLSPYPEAQEVVATIISIYPEYR